MQGHDELFRESGVSLSYYIRLSQKNPNEPKNSGRSVALFLQSKHMGDRTRRIAVFEAILGYIMSSKTAWATE